ncbi:hypothetical protein LCGC14_0326300 [marine sediment metagenome]|uniref:YprB ribonuclease H-like domain-containing protein n=1 Tax=marine sediment metagenome TaxID=412755 RepID=A0A0F9TNH7_9ZZZZ
MPEAVVFDIETGPLPDGVLERLAPPFDPLKFDKGGIIGREFDKDADVKLGNASLAKTVAKKISEGRVKFAAKQADLVKQVETARQTAFGKFRDKAALSAMTGQVLATGYFNQRIQIDSRDERDQLLKFWGVAKETIGRGNRMIGFDIFRFDLPFLAHRTWVLRLSFPLSEMFDGRKWNAGFIDIREVYRLGVYGEYISLDTLAKGLGVGQKTPDMSGADFYKVWATNRNKAKAYLANDLTNTRACAERLGCLNV